MTPSVDLRRFKRVIGLVAEEELGGTIAVRWADQPFPRPLYPFIELKVMSGPTPTHLPRTEARTLPELVRVTFADAAADSEVILDVNATRYRTVAATDTAHRDLMLIRLASSDDAIAAEPVGNAQLDISATAAGSLWRTRVHGVATLNVLASADYLITSSRCRVSVSVNAHQKALATPEPAEILQALLDALHDPSTREYLRANRIGFSALLSSAMRDLSYVEGVEIAARSQRDLEFSVEARRARALTPIEAVDFRGSVT